MKNNIPLFITICAQDKVGKDTIKEALHKITNYKHVIVCRTFISGAVYSDIYNRDIKPETYMKMLYNAYIDIPHLIIYLTADEAVVLERSKNTNEEIKIPYKLHRETFDKYIREAKQLGLNVVTLDNTNLTIEDTAELLKKYINNNYSKLIGNYR